MQKQPGDGSSRHKSTLKQVHCKCSAVPGCAVNAVQVSSSTVTLLQNRKRLLCAGRLLQLLSRMPACLQNCPAECMMSKSRAA